MTSISNPKNLGVSHISVCSLQYDTDGMLTLKTVQTRVCKAQALTAGKMGQRMYLEPALAPGLALQSASCLHCC